MAEGQQLRLEPCRHCPTCPASYFCDEGATEFGCDNEFTRPQQTEGGGRDIMHPLRPDLTERLAECGGLDIRIRTRAAQQALPRLPSYIPRVQPQAGFESPQCLAVAVPLERVGLSGHVRTAAEMKTALGLPPETVIIVTSFQDDRVLERVWRGRRPLAESLASAGYDLITVPNFSVWEGDTRLEHRYNIARSLRMFEILLEAGVPAVPHVSWYLERDLDDWIRELRRWAGLRAFSLDLSTLESRQAWAWAMPGLRRFFHGIGQEWEVLVNGPSVRRRICDVSEICGHIHLTNERPFQLAMSRHVTIDELLTSRTQRTPKARMEIFALEVRKMVDAVGPAPACCRLSAGAGLRA